MAKKPSFKCAQDPEVDGLAEILKVVSDPNRLRILCSLFSGEKCVCELEEGLGISQPLASHHLGVLREAGLVEVRKEGTWSYYSLVGEAVRKLNHGFLNTLGQDRLSAATEARSAYCCAPGAGGNRRSG